MPSGQPGRVLVVPTGGDPTISARRRLTNFGADMDRITVAPDLLRGHSDSDALQAGRGLPALEDRLANLLPDLVVIDRPEVNLAGWRNGRRAGEANVLRRCLADFGRRYRCAIIAVCRLTPGVNLNPLRPVVHATGVLLVTRDPRDPGRSIMTPLRNRAGPLGKAQAFRVSEHAGQS